MRRRAEASSWGQLLVTVEPTAIGGLVASHTGAVEAERQRQAEQRVRHELDRQLGSLELRQQRLREHEEVDGEQREPVHPAGQRHGAVALEQRNEQREHDPVGGGQHEVVTDARLPTGSVPE